MGIPFKESLTIDIIAKQFSSIQLTKHIYNNINHSIPFDIGTDETSSGFQSGKFVVINENAPLYNNNGGFIIRKKGFYKIELSLRMLTQNFNPTLNIKKNNVIVGSIVLSCFSSVIVGTTINSMTSTNVSNIIECNIGDVITFDAEITQNTPNIVGNPMQTISYINIFEI
jgi:hypothetical protein|tara:strand:- start:288 stop:797 length:510 start_codon:yes stop_codon:yes gene_type:complete